MESCNRSYNEKPRLSHCQTESGPCGRGDWIRTSDFLLPKQARYQAALHPVARPVARRAVACLADHGGCVKRDGRNVAFSQLGERRQVRAHSPALCPCLFLAEQCVELGACFVLSGHTGRGAAQRWRRLVVAPKERIELGLG